MRGMRREEVSISNPEKLSITLDLLRKQSDRIYKHTFDFKHRNFDKSTNLSKYIWKLKDHKYNFEIKWRILSRAKSYNSATKNAISALRKNTTSHSSLRYQPLMKTMRYWRNVCIEGSGSYKITDNDRKQKAKLFLKTECCDWMPNFQNIFGNKQIKIHK